MDEKKVSWSVYVRAWHLHVKMTGRALQVVGVGVRFGGQGADVPTYLGRQGRLAWAGGMGIDRH